VDCADRQQALGPRGAWWRAVGQPEERVTAGRGDLGERGRVCTMMFGERRGQAPVMFFPKSRILRWPRPS
jgi:hypothetical protein